MANKTSRQAPAWVTFIGVLLLLLGIYTTSRTIVNSLVLDKYPSMSFFSFPFVPYPTRDQDCMYPTYAQTPADEANAKQQQKICLDGVKEARYQAKTTDIAHSFLFLFLGAGILLARKRVSF